jgi:hypothetical protein
MATGFGIPHINKLNFTSHDGLENPLNWLTHCEQFFLGQHTLASYNLHGTTQTWFYALEPNKGFKELCNLHFRPAISTNHLSILARLPFTFMVHDNQEHFNALICHTP